VIGMGKKDKKSPKPKTPTPQRSEEAPSPLHSGSEAVVAAHDRDNPAMTADSDAAISERMQRRESGASLPNGPHDNKGRFRHGGTGQYTEGPSMPDMGHEAVQLDLNDPAAQAAMIRTTPTSMPNGMPPPPGDIGPAVNVLDSGDLEDLTR
jgi:hypothetical protein